MIMRSYAQKLHGQCDSASGQPPSTHPMPLHMMTRGFACSTLWDGTYSGLIGDQKNPYLRVFNILQFLVNSARINILGKFIFN